MDNTLRKNPQYFVLIVDQRKKEQFLTLLHEHGAHRILTKYGHSSVCAGALARAFGFDAEQGKAVISCIFSYDKAAEIIDILCREHHFDKANTGIAFTVNIDGFLA